MGRRVKYIILALTVIIASSLLLTGCPQIDLKLFVEELINSAQPDNSPPSVLSVTPTDGATGVDRIPSVTIEFSEAVDPATISEATFQVNSASTSLPGTISYNDASNTATFVPDNELTLLSNLTVIVTTAITDNAGNALSEDYTWNFQIRDGVWGTMAYLESSTDSHLRPAVDIDSDGNAIAVWYQDNDRIKSSRFVNDASPGWTNVENVDFNTPAGNGINPDIAVNSAGNAFAVWKHDDAAQDQFRANFYDASSGWRTTNTVVYNPGGNLFGDIFVDADASGNAFAVMKPFDIEIRAKIDTGTSWDTASQAVLDTAAMTSSTPSVAVSSNGSAVVVFGESNSIRANRYDGSSWNSPGPIDVRNVPEFIEDNPRVAVSPNGKAFIVWSEEVNPDAFLYARTLEGVNLGLSVLLGATSSGTFFQPKIAAAPDGSAFVVYRTDDNKIYARRYNGTSWDATPVELAFSAVSVANPHIGMDPMGNAVAVWSEEGTKVFAKRFRNDGSGWQSTKRPLQSATGAVSVLDIAVSDNGTAVVVWGQTGTYPDIVSNMFK